MRYFTRLCQFTWRVVNSSMEDGDFVFPKCEIQHLDAYHVSVFVSKWGYPNYYGKLSSGNDVLSSYTVKFDEIWYPIFRSMTCHDFPYWGGLPMSLARTTRSRRSSRSLMRTMMVRSAQIHSTYRHGKIISSGVEICSWHGMTWHDMPVEEFQYLPREEVSVDPNNFSKNKSEFWKVSSPWLILVLRSVVFFHFFFH